MPSPDGPLPAKQITRLRWLELAALVLAALFAIQFQLRLPGRLVDEESYRKVAEVLRQEGAPGDVLLLTPWWTERARLYAPDGLPVVGYHEDSKKPSVGSDGDDLIAHPRIWVLAQPELPYARQEAFEAAFKPGREPVGPERRFGNLKLTLYRNGRHRPALFSAAEAFARAKVYLEMPGEGRSECPFDGRAHRCQNGQTVEPQWHELLFEPRRCLWMHPPGGRGRLVAEWDAPSAELLSLEGGIIWEHAPRKDPGITPLHVGVDDAESGERLLELTVNPGVEGVQRAQRAGTKGGRLKLWVQSDNKDARETCVDLFALGAAR